MSISMRFKALNIRFVHYNKMYILAAKLIFFHWYVIWRLTLMWSVNTSKGSSLNSSTFWRCSLYKDKHFLLRFLFISNRSKLKNKTPCKTLIYSYLFNGSLNIFETSKSALSNFSATRQIVGLIVLCCF